jgi:hypothetical protein
LRRSSKETRALKASVNRRLQAEADAAIKAPPLDTFSARMPAYVHTSLCPKPELREALARKKEADGN